MLIKIVLALLLIVAGVLALGFGTKEAFGWFLLALGTSYLANILVQLT